jgi:hypothetical protein
MRMNPNPHAAMRDKSPKTAAEPTVPIAEVAQNAVLLTSPHPASRNHSSSSPSSCVEAIAGVIASKISKNRQRRSFNPSDTTQFRSSASILPFNDENRFILCNNGEITPADNHA